MILFESILGFFLLYLISMGAVIFVGYFLQRGKEQKYLTQHDSIRAEEITVLIPFRNEANRLPDLLNSIQQLEAYPQQFIFIDDHSSDEGVQRIKDALADVPFQILSCPSDVNGKKQALRYAIEKVSTAYILTMDADIEIPSGYFTSIERLGNADMYVLPAVMKAKQPLHFIFELDLVLVNAGNAGLAGLTRPIFSSGANLLYRKDTFDEVDDYASHAHAASGDDTYLLRDFRNNKCDVRVCTDPALAISTETPQSFKEFIEQRLRWIGKTTDVKDHLSTALAVFQACLTIGFVALSIYLCAKGYWMLFVLVYVTKTVIDLLLFMPYFNRIQRMITWLFIPFYEVLFPIYTLLILVLMPFYKPKWKGRTIYH